MGEVHALDALLRDRPIWRGRAPVAAPQEGIATGIAALDAVLPAQGWVAAGLNELLVPCDGVGELELLWPVLARATVADGQVALITPPYLPYAPAWHAAGVRLERLHVVRADPREALWAAEQCMRSGACTAVLCWPQTVDDRALRRLQVAAEAGQCHGFAIRPLQAARNPSPSPLRIAIEPGPPRMLRVLKCRGANPPSRPVPFPAVG
ncbi:translesion DNA synthesis-associated protein ImuA [Lysobacter xanthus]